MSLLQDIKSVLLRHHMPISKGVNLVSFTGVDVVNGQLRSIPNTINYFNDKLFVLDFDQGLIRHFTCTAGEPGWYWIKHSSYKGPTRGAPFTCPGQYEYVRGSHSGRQAMRQSPSDRGRLKVVRDVDQNGVLDRRDLIDRPHTTGINIHAAGHLSSLIGVASSGCHVIKGSWTGSEWKSFHNLIYNRWQSKFPYTVLKGEWFFDKMERILIGSKGLAVKNLQVILKEKRGMSLNTDGDFWHQTDIRVGQWQSLNGLMPTGIVEADSKWMRDNIFHKAG